MRVGLVNAEHEQPFVVFEGEPGSFRAYRPEAGPELSEAAATLLFHVSRQAGQLAQDFQENKLSPAARQPYETWARDLLATGAVFLRAELSLRPDVQDNPVPDGGVGQLRLLVRRGGRVESVDAGDNAVPVLLLHEIPLFVEVALLREIGGLK